MEDKEITPDASIAIIMEMIGKTKRNISDNSFYFIFWGWLVFIASLTQYISINLHFKYGDMVWFLMPAGAVVTIIYSKRSNKKRQVRTYMDAFVGYLWIGFGLALLVTLVMGGIYGIKATFFFLMVLYGVFTFITGAVLKFPPLVFGGLCALSCALLSAFLSEQNQLLCIALALLLSYIIPGHLLAYKHKKA